MRQAVLTALVEIVRNGKTSLVPSVTFGGEGAGGLAGLPGLLLAMAAKDLVPAKDGETRVDFRSARSAPVGLVLTEEDQRRRDDVGALRSRLRPRSHDHSVV